MQTLNYNGRVVATKKQGKWEPVGDIPMNELNIAFREGQVVSDDVPSKEDSKLHSTLMALFYLSILVLFILKVLGQW